MSSQIRHRQQAREQKLRLRLSGRFDVVIVLFVGIFVGANEAARPSRHQEQNNHMSRFNHPFPGDGNGGGGGREATTTTVGPTAAESDPWCLVGLPVYEENILAMAAARNITSRQKVDILGEILKYYVQALRRTANRKVELVFVVDASGSVGPPNFANELKFVKKLLSDFTVDRHTTRVSVITYSSRSRVVRHIDHLTQPKDVNNKCSLLEEEIPKIGYSGGATYTLGGLQEAQVGLSVLISCVR